MRKNAYLLDQMRLAVLCQPELRERVEQQLRVGTQGTTQRALPELLAFALACITLRTDAEREEVVQVALQHDHV